MISFAQAQALIEALPLSSRPERLPLSTALGRVLAEDLVLPRDQPPFDRATMDGYAVAVPPEGAPFAEHVRVVGEVRAGGQWRGALSPGEALRVMTGAPCPPGTTVVPVEQTTPVGTPEPPPAACLVACDPAALVRGRNIAWRGEDGRQGAVAARRGTMLQPAVAALAGMCGADHVAVEPMPRLAIITTGDEVRAAGESGIGDSNGPYLEAFARTLGCPVRREHVADQAGALAAAIARARDQAELVVTTGGVSGSATDLVPEAVLACGFATVFHQVAIQPGKPVLLARHPGGCLLAGLPGNAVSVVATAHLFVLPVLGRLLGGWRWSWFQLPLAQARPGAKRHQFLPARLGPQGVEVLPWNGSGDLLAAAAADGLVELPAGLALSGGAVVRFLPYVGASAAGAGLIPPRPAR